MLDLSNASIGGTSGNSDSLSSQGLTRVLGAKELDKIPILTMAGKAMKLIGKPNASADGSVKDASLTREVSPRRQVGDAESMVYAPTSSSDPTKVPWWRREGIEEGV